MSIAAIPPWANGPFELLVHAEGHYRAGEDFDRRMALIGFDNAVEVSVSTYLSLQPIMRGGRQYERKDVEKWQFNYPNKLDFLHAELTARSLAWPVDRTHILWAHTHRNEQYHGGNKGTPERQVLQIIRGAALWVFGVLFEVADVEHLLETAVAEKLPPAVPQPQDEYDRAIDTRFGIITVAGKNYYCSEILFAADRDAYHDIGARLCTGQPLTDDGDDA